MIRFIFLILFSTTAFGQIDTAKVKIIPKHYYEYKLKESSDCESDSTPQGYKPLEMAKEITYPSINTSDSSLNKFITTNIKRTLKQFDMEHPQKKKNWGWICISDAPYTIEVNYELVYKSSKYLSLIMTVDEEAGRGSNGTSNNVYPFTFDFMAKKLLSVGDIVEHNSDSIVYNIIVENIKSQNPDLINEFDNPSLVHFCTILNLPVVIQKDKMVLYWPVSWGGHGWYSDVSIFYRNHQNIFRKDFIKTL